MKITIPNPIRINGEPVAAASLEGPLFLAVGKSSAS